MENGLLFKELLQTPNFRITVVDDADTVELCGALKVKQPCHFCLREESSLRATASVIASHYKNEFCVLRSYFWENSELAVLFAASCSAPAFPGWLDFLSQLWYASVCKSGSSVLVCSLGSGQHEHLESRGQTLIVESYLGAKYSVIPAFLLRVILSRKRNLVALDDLLV